MILIFYILKLYKLTNTSNNILRLLIEKEKLSETNFLEWHRNMRIVLTDEKELYVLGEPIPEALPAGAPAAQRNAYNRHLNDYVKVTNFSSGMSTTIIFQRDFPNQMFEGHLI